MANYRYIGKDDLQYDDANEDYSLVIVMGDNFSMYQSAGKFVLHHEDSPSIEFHLTKAEAKALEKKCEVTLTVEPDVNNPPYLLFEPKFELVKQIYDYYNKMLFNNKCPPIKLRRTKKSSVWGMALMEWAAPGKPIFTFWINESSMIDRVLFTNTIIHEMIHLYLFKSGSQKLSTDPEQAMREIHAEHGPLFQNEMHRVNAKGFHVIMAGTHEEIARNSTEEFYAIVAQLSNGWLAWYSQYPLDQGDLDNVTAQVKVKYPHEAATITAFTTKERKYVTYGTHLKSSKTITSASLEKLQPRQFPMDPNAGIIGKNQLTKSVAVALPTPKERPETYALPFDKFCHEMKKFGADNATLFSTWKTCPLRIVNAQMETKLKTLIGQVRRGAIEMPEILNKLADVKAAYEQRFPHQQYVNAIVTILNKQDSQGLLQDYHKTMRLY